MTTDNEKLKNIPFEEALNELERIVADMETADLDLDTALEQFEKGSRLAAYCGKKLSEAEEKIEILIKSLESNDSLQWKTFESTHGAQKTDSDS